MTTVTCCSEQKIFLSFKTKSCFIFLSHKIFYVLPFKSKKYPGLLNFLMFCLFTNVNFGAFLWDFYMLENIVSSCKVEGK